MPPRPREPEVSTPNAPPPGPPESTPERHAAAPKKDQLQALLWNPARNLTIQVTKSEVIHLKPGWNFVAVETWAKAKDRDMVQVYINTKIPQARSPEEMSNKIGQPHLVVGKVMDRSNPLRQLDMQEALLFVQETLVVATLKALSEQEQRPEILRAIRGQIEGIEKPKDAERRERERRDAEAT